MSESSSFATAANIFAAPGEAFRAIKSRPTVLLPILALVICYSAVSLLYMQSVDLPWFFEQQLANAPNELTASEREAALRTTSAISGTTLGAISAVTSSIFIVLLLFCVSLYYTGISFATNDGVKLKQWFALSCWCSLPLCLGVVASVVNIAAGDARFMAQEAMNPLALGNLFALEIESPTIAQRILLALDLTYLWSLALMVLAYQAWTQRSIVKSVAIVLGPLAAIMLLTTLPSLL